MLPTEVRARKGLRHRLRSRGGRRRGSARLPGSLGLPRLLASVPQAEWRVFFPERRTPAEPEVWGHAQGQGVEWGRGFS